MVTRRDGLRVVCFRFRIIRGVHLDRDTWIVPGQILTGKPPGLYVLYCHNIFSYFGSQLHTEIAYHTSTEGGGGAVGPGGWGMCGGPRRVGDVR